MVKELVVGPEMVGRCDGYGDGNYDAGGGRSADSGKWWKMVAGECIREKTQREK